MFCFMSFLYQSKLKGNHEIESSANSSEVRDIFVASLAISFMLAVERCVELISCISHGNILRLIRVLGLLLASIVTLKIIIPLNLVDIIPVIMNSQRLILLFGFFQHINLSGSSVWDFKSVLVILGFLSFTLILDSFSPFFHVYAAAQINFVFYCIGMSLFLWKSLFWVIFAYEKCSKYSKRLNFDEYCCTIYVIAVLTYLVTISIEHSIFYGYQSVDWLQCTPNYLSTRQYTDLVLLAWTSIMSNQSIHRQHEATEVSATYSMFKLPLNV